MLDLTLNFHIRQEISVSEFTIDMMDSNMRSIQSFKKFHVFPQKTCRNSLMIFYYISQNKLTRLVTPLHPVPMMMRPLSGLRKEEQDQLVPPLM